ncbi:MAG TPA: hypothetical protein VK465_05790 [Fibrobacteria bacterium]|nr:hypothetical protein [Fibrobacteria bacterium]
MHRKIDDTPEFRKRANGSIGKQSGPLNRLKAANDTVDETRSLLPYGRGNVVEDNKRTHYESSRRDEAVMHMLNENSPKGDDPKQLTAAMFRFAKAARCGGSAPIATHLHGNKLKGNYRANTVELDRVDHTHTEVTRGNVRRQNDPIIDAWLDGPAVLREDARYGKSDGKAIHQLDEITGPEAARNVERISARLEADPHQKNLLKYYIGTGEFDYHSDGYKRYATEFYSRSVYNEDFQIEAGKALHGLSGHSSMIRKSKPATLAQEIQAVGVALSLNGGLASVSPDGAHAAGSSQSGKIRNALAEAPGIIESAKRQFPPQNY